MQQYKGEPIPENESISEKSPQAQSSHGVS